ALGQTKRGAVGVSISAALAEVRGLDHERVALPVAACVPHVETDASTRMRPGVEADDPGFMNHLVANRDVSRSLDDLIGVAVHARNHRPGKPARDAALPQAEVLGAVERAAAEAAAGAGRP